MNRTYVPTFMVGRYDRDAVRRTAPRQHARTAQAVYRQRRLTATLLLAVVAGLMPAVMMLASTAPARADAVRAVRPSLTVVVDQGDTLWDLALAHAPSRQDPMAYVAEVIALNDVKAAALEPGMVLRLPRQ